MQFLTLYVEIYPWEGRSYEVIARLPQGEVQGQAAGLAARPLWNSARGIVRFPLSSAALAVRLPGLRAVLSHTDLAAGRSGDADEQTVSEFATLLYHFLFTGEILTVFKQAHAFAVSEWKGLRLRLNINAPDLHSVPWEVLWDILAFDLQSMRRGLFDLRIERNFPELNRGSNGVRFPDMPLHPVAASAEHQPIEALLHQADAAFYSPDFPLAAELYRQCLRLEPNLRQVRELLARAETCLKNSHSNTVVPPRAAACYQRAWETYTQYRFDEALRWINTAWLLAKDWGIAEWPESKSFHAQIERGLSGYANYLESLKRFEQGDITGAIEAAQQAFRADPLELYHAQLEAWSRISGFEEENPS